MGAEKTLWPMTNYATRRPQSAAIVGMQKEPSTQAQAKSGVHITPTLPHLGSRFERGKRV